MSNSSIEPATPAVGTRQLSAADLPEGNPSLPLGIVTVTYSPGDYLQHFLDSIESALSCGARVVLADNGSQDGVPEKMADAYKFVEFASTGGNLGYGGGMNYGVNILRHYRDAGEINSDFLLIVNPDVTFTPGSVDKLISCAHANSRAGAVGPRIVEPDGTSYPSARALPSLSTGVGHALFGALWPNNPWTKAYLHAEDMDVSRESGWLSGSCLLVRWEVFDKIGGFDERYFMYLEDVDLCDRISRAGWVNVYCADSIITHAQGHSTAAHSRTMLRAHHESTFRYLSDRYAATWQAPLRWALKLGLGVRAALAELASSFKGN